MKPIQLSQRIDAPVDAVFAATSDFASMDQRISGITKVEMLTDGDVGVGTRFRETRVMMGKEATEEMTVTRFDPPHGYTLEAESCGTHYISRFDFVPDSDRTRITMSFSGTPQSMLGRVFGLLMLPMMKKMVVRCIEQDLKDIKSYIESGAGASPISAASQI